DILSESLGHRNDDLRRRGLLLRRLRKQFLVALVTRLGFGLAGLGRRRNPFLFGRERALPRFLLAAFLFQALLLLAKPRGVIALIGNALAAIELEDPAG